MIRIGSYRNSSPLDYNRSSLLHMVSIKASRSHRGGGGGSWMYGGQNAPPPSRFHVTFLLTAFVVLTTLTPLLRFWRYDDSHLFNPPLPPLIENHHAIRSSTIEQQDSSNDNDVVVATKDDKPPVFSLDDELRDANAYLHSFRDFKRSLIFFHIPKTAGTAIEYAAGQQHIPWGSCRFRHKPKRDICNYPKRGEECTS
jgi:hypothetical protein